MTTSRDGIRRRVGVTWLLSAALTWATSAAAIDLAGHWLVEGGDQGPAFVEITQVGDVVSFAMDAISPASGTFAGPVTGPGDFTLAGAGSCTASPLYARLVPGGTAFNGVFATACSGPILFYPTFTRCTCFDGNLVDGDGCDASCQTEACFTCSGDPSVCAPTPDGQACDDRRDCTSGETCAAGVCGGGAPVTPCIDMTGSWHVVETIDGLGLSEEYDRDFTQRGGMVRTPGYIGTIDPVAGVFVLASPTGSVFFFGGSQTVFLPLTGTAGPATFTGSGVKVIGRSSFVTQLSAIRNGCGDGLLDPGEQCDDGGTLSGDGCDATCQIEPCHACSGTPSACAPVTDGTPCSDGDACTTGDACSAGICAAGDAVACGPCTSCAPASGTCEAAPRTACRSSLRARASTLALRNGPPGRPDLVRWRWSRGAATALGELGDPINGDDYALCVFDDSASPASLLLVLSMPGGGDCGGSPCWRAHPPAGVAYRDRDRSLGATVALVVDPGAQGDARAKLTARGPSLPLPALPLPVPLRVQLQIENGTCLEARYDADGVSRNDAGTGTFRAVGAP